MKMPDAKMIIAGAFLTLARQKAIEKITVSEIVEAAEVSRQTFYNHFENKNALVTWVFKHSADKILAEFTESDGDVPFIECLQRTFELLVDYREFYKRAFRVEGRESFISNLTAYTSTFYENYVAERFGKEALDDELLFSIRFHSYGAAHISRDWLMSELNITSQQLAERYMDNMPAKLRRYLEFPAES